MEESERICPHCGPESKWAPGIVRHADCIHWRSVNMYGVQTGATLLLPDAEGVFRATEGRYSDLRPYPSQYIECGCAEKGCGHTSLGNYYRIEQIERVWI